MFGAALGRKDVGPGQSAASVSFFEDPENSRARVDVALFGVTISLSASVM